MNTNIINFFPCSSCPSWLSIRANYRRALGGFVDDEAELLDHGIAHYEFLDLAGHRHGEIVDETDVGRHLVVRYLFATVISNFVLGR